MSSTVAGDIEAPVLRHGGLQKTAVVAAKLIVTAACFWYVGRQIDFSRALSAIPSVDLRWLAIATVIAVVQIPIAAIRWRQILFALKALSGHMTAWTLTTITGIGVFFGQVLPSGASEGVRAWLLVHVDASWRDALTSVVIDRVTGLMLLMVVGFAALVLPSALTALGGYRTWVLLAYAAVLIGSIAGLLSLPWLTPLLRRWRYTRWLANMLDALYVVVLGPQGPAILGLAFTIHLLTMAIVWALARGQGITLPLADVLVLFSVMVGIVVLPISMGGWGLRELAVISLLAPHGVAPETALLFSICFGLVLLAGSLPGAVIWLFYSPAPARASEQRS
ncbi:MAG: YbhN family protein [Xanthobacteraceae bacterium]